MGKLIFEGTKKEYDALIKSMAGRCPDLDGDCPNDKGCKAHWQATIEHRPMKAMDIREQEV